MLPLQYTTPAAIILVVGGLVSCFLGYRFFRVVLGLFGFILGALITTSMMGTANTVAQVLAALVGGLLGAALIFAAYFVGVGLVGAFLAALVLNLGWRYFGGEPPTILLVVACVLGALGALSVVRHVIVFGTALAGAWMLMIGGWALFGDRAQFRAASSHDIWAVYPLDLLPAQWWVTPLWLAIALVGILVQLMTSAPKSTKLRTGSPKK